MALIVAFQINVLYKVVVGNHALANKKFIWENIKCQYQLLIILVVLAFLLPFTIYSFDRKKCVKDFLKVFLLEWIKWQQASYQYSTINIISVCIFPDILSINMIFRLLFIFNPLIYVVDRLEFVNKPYAVATAQRSCA